MSIDDGGDDWEAGEAREMAADEMDDMRRDRDELVDALGVVLATVDMLMERCHVRGENQPLEESVDDDTRLPRELLARIKGG